MRWLTVTDKNLLDPSSLMYRAVKYMVLPLKSHLTPFYEKPNFKCGSLTKGVRVRSVLESGLERGWG